MSKAKSPHVVDVTDCSDCIFYRDDERNGLWCAAPDGCGTKLKLWRGRVIVDKTGSSCSLLRQDVLVRRAADGGAR